MTTPNQTSSPNGKTGCRLGFWYDNKTEICRLKEYDYLDWDDIATTIFIILSFLCILTNLLVIGIFIKNRKTPVVKASNRELSFLLLLLLTMAFVIPLTHIGMPTVGLCTSHIIIQGPLLAGILSIFLVKTHRVLQIFRARQPRLTSRQWFLGKHLQFVAVFALVFVQVLLVTTYVITKPPTVKMMHLENIHTKYVYVECNYGGGYVFGLTYVYVITIALFGFIFAVRSRHLPSNFRESRHIAASLATTLIVWGALLPVSPVTHGRLNAILTIICLNISPLGQLTFLFFPKCYIILFCPHLNTVQELRRMTLAHMQRRSTFCLNMPALSRLNAIERSDEQDTRSEQQSPRDTSSSTFQPSERTRSEGIGRSVCFIEDEFIAATSESNEPRDIVNVTLHASASFGIGLDNLAFVSDMPTSDPSNGSNVIRNNQDSRPRSISAKEAAELEKALQLQQHSGISKRKSEPALNSWSTFESDSRDNNIADTLRISLTSTVTATTTIAPLRSRSNTTYATLSSPVKEVNAVNDDESLLKDNQSLPDKMEEYAEDVTPEKPKSSYPKSSQDNECNNNLRVLDPDQTVIHVGEKGYPHDQVRIKKIP